jgi:arabinogalactan oligomer/maltooligosaccharide transport system substrate-binding protein
MPGPRHLIALLLLALALGGCAPKTSKDTVVLWTAFEGVELETLRKRVDAFKQESGHEVVMLKVPFPSLQRKVLVAGPALQGPDVLIGPHDWIGILETADLLAPIPKDVVKPGDERFYSVAVNAVKYDGEVYSAPMMMECVVLVRNTDLVPRKPANLGELVSMAEEVQQGDTLGFAYRPDDFYFTWAFMAGFGADFLAPFSEKDLDLDNLDFNTPEAVQGAEWVADLQLKYKLIPPGMENQTAVDLFLNNRLGMMLCGPWNLGAIRKAGISYQLEPIPQGPKAESSPFVGVTGAMMSRYSVEKPGVKELIAYLSSAETGAQLCQASGRAPTRLDTAEMLVERVTDPVVSRDLNLFSEAAQHGTPLPNHPAMAPVWASMKTCLELITTGQTPANEELERTTERVRTKIRFMME